MALGYCNGCGKLVTIVANGLASPNQLESRRQAWYPVPHANADGKPCDGTRKPL